MKKLTFITGNPGKAKYLGDYFDITVDHLKLDLPEIQSLDLREIVSDKARKAFEIVKSPVIVEDVSLVFNGLGNLPGPLIKWFFESLGNSGLCDLINKLGDSGARAEVMFAICDESGVYIFGGFREGSIASVPRGEAGFGWDPIFIPKGYNQTWAEMDVDAKHATSMRKIALAQLTEYINKAPRKAVID